MPIIRASALAASEGAGFVDILVTLDQATSSEVRASFETLSASANDATSQADFQRASGTLIFSPGESSKTVRVVLVDNTSAEATENFWFQLGNPVNASIAQTLTPVLLFDNDGTAGTPGLSVSDVVIDERTKTASFFVSLNRPSASTVGVSYTTANDSASAGSDFQAATGQLSFAPGEMVKTVSVALIDDATAEPDEVFKLLLSAASNATILNDTGRARIGANDAAAVSTPYVTAKPAAADESQALIGFVVQLSAPSNNEVKVKYDTLNGTASYSASTPDFQRVTGTLVFAPGETTRFVSVPVVNDILTEKPEAFWLELSSPINTVIAQRLTPGLLIDNDAAAGQPIVQVSGDPFVDEMAGTISHFVWLDRPSSVAITLQWVGVAGTAGGSDARLSSGTITFAPGETVKTVSTTVLDDTTAEPIESFTLGLVVAPGSNARLANIETEAIITANDGTTAAMPYIRALPSATDEAQALTGFTVLLSAPSNSEVRVNFDTVNATADFTSSLPEFLHTSGTLVFAPGETSRFVPVLGVDDSVAEGLSSYWLELSSAVNATVEQRLTPGLVVDNDGFGTGNGEPLASVSDAVVDEKAGVAVFFISLDRPATGFGWVSYKTVDGTATAGSDYRAVTGSASFMPGESVATVTVPIYDDGLTETDERFALVLTPAVGSQVLDAAGTAVIGRNDGTALSRPVISAGPITVSEADALAMFVLQLSAPSSNEVRVTVDIGNGTATYLTSTPDVQRLNTTLVFAPGQTTKTVFVPLLNDSTNEGSESFNLMLTNPVNATLAQASVAATLLDNDGGSALLRLGISNDVYTLVTGTERIAESPGGGIDTVKSAVSYTLPDNVENLLLSGTAGSAIGNAGNNVLRGTAGANTLDGQDGIDTAIFSTTRAASTVSGTTESRTVSTTLDGSDTLLSIERLQFSDTVVAYDTSPGGHVHGAYAMWNAAFNAAPSAQDLSRWTAMLDTLGGNTTDLAQTMINAYAPGVSDAALVSYLWGTIVGGTIPADQLAAFTGLISAGTYTQASLLALVATLELNTTEITAIVGQPQALDPAYFPIPG